MRPLVPYSDEQRRDQIGEEMSESGMWLFAPCKSQQQQERGSEQGAAREPC